MKKLSVLNSIIVRELLKRKYYSACLSTALIFCDEATKLGYKPEIIVSHLRHKMIPHTALHFCAKIGEEIFDPSLKVLQHYSGVNTEDMVFSVIPDETAMTDEDKLRMMDYYKKYKHSQCSAQYFNDAPQILRDINKKVQLKVKKLLLK